MPLTTLLIDLDGVLRTWPDDYDSIERQHNLPTGSLNQTAFEAGLLERVVTGKIKDSEWRDTVVESLTALHPMCLAKEAVATWSKPAGSLNHEVVELVTEIRKTLKVGLVTNATDRLAFDLNALGLQNTFDFIVNSSEIGFMKPRVEFYQRALSIAKAEPSETIFVDDTIGNVSAAIELGIKSHRFGTVSAFKAFVASLGLV